MRGNRRIDRRGSHARGPMLMNLEALETRTMLSVIPGVNPYRPTDLSIMATLPGTKGTPFNVANPNSPYYNNAGKYITGQDRAGNNWTIQVFGPGQVIVTDISPNDGVLDDNINTIQLVGTTSQTRVVGTVSQSIYTQDANSGTILFNQLTDNSPVGSIVLKGFTLQQTVTPPAGQLNNYSTYISLLGGVGLLELHNIEAPIDVATSDLPINITIGDPSAPIKQHPVIRIDSIYNTVINSSQTAIPSTPQVTPTVNLDINGVAQSISVGSIGQQAEPGAYQYLFPNAFTTGRTSIRANAINTLNVAGSATNVTAARESQPFKNGFSGLSSLRSAHFGGTADGVGIDVAGPIGTLRFDRGLGNPLGAPTTLASSGIPTNLYGFPAAGLQGGLVTANSIHRVVVGPANQILQTPINPNNYMLYSTRTPAYKARPGNALTNAAITSAASIDSVSITGQAVNSEVKSGFFYPSYAAGLHGTRAASHINYAQQGDLTGSVISATYRPYQHYYGTPHDIAGQGYIASVARGSGYSTGQTTPLGNIGVGIYARKVGGPIKPRHK